MTYDTMNPLGSTAPKDLFDNAHNIDYFANGQEPFYPDRFKVQRLSLAGMRYNFNSAQEGRAAQFAADQASREMEFNEFLTDSAYVPMGNYSAGLQFDRYNQYVAYGGNFYTPAPGSLPFTTSGTWEGADDELFVLFNQDTALRQELGGTGGASIVRTASGATVEEALKNVGNWISPFAFGAVGGFQGDDTLSVSMAIGAAKDRGVPLLLDGKFRVGTAKVSDLNGFTIVSNGGVLLGLAEGTAERVLEIKNCTDLAVVGRLIVSADYNANYKEAVKIWADYPGGCSLIDVQNVSPVGARVGFTIGDINEPDRLVSEITIAGGHFYGCPCAYDVIGTQTVVTLAAVNAITGTNNGPEGWDELPRVNIRLRGSMLNMIGGELMLTDATTGLAVSVEPIVSPTYSNPYGQFTAVGVCIESASQFVHARNPDSVPNPGVGTGLIRISDCPGFHSQNQAPLIQSDADFSGRISIGANGFFCTATRTQPNIQAANPATEIFVQRDSFGRGFNPTLGGVVGGKLRFDRRVILIAGELGNQPLPNATSTTLLFQSLDQSGDLARWSSGYNPATGIFTVPPGGLSDVEIRGQFVANNLTAGEMYVQVDGVSFAVSRANVAQSAIAVLGRLDAGQQVKIVANNSSSGDGIVAAGGPTGAFTITASN